MKYPILALVGCWIAFALPVGAAEGDASHAPPERWAHPRGPASGSGRSRARGPENFGGILWSVRAKTLFLCPPVTWDGAVFAIDGSTSKARLLALDGETGKRLGAIGIEGAGIPAPAASDRSVFLLTRQGRRLEQFHLKGRRLDREWSFTVEGKASPPRIHGGEIYLPTSRGLVRLRAGRSKPVWRAGGDFMGEPAVFGDHVYALRRTEDGGLELALFLRADGTPASSLPLAGSAGAGRGGRVAISKETVAVLVPPDKRKSWRILARKYDKDKKTVTLVEKITETFLTQPLVGGGPVIAMSPRQEWGLWNHMNKKRPYFTIVKKADRPDLFNGTSSCVSLDGLISFGTWASLINGGLIEWHLGWRRGVTAFADGVRFGTVPVRDGLILAVTRDGKALHAIHAEELGE